MQLVSLIRKDELNVQEEREVYNAVLKWVKYDEDNRYPKMEHILYAVRCFFLTPNFLKEQMKNCDVIRRVPACREYLARIFKDLTLHKRPREKERKPNTTRMIFVAGGYFQHSLDTLEGFNVDDKTWTTLPKLTGENFEFVNHITEMLINLFVFSTSFWTWSCIFKRNFLRRWRKK